MVSECVRLHGHAAFLGWADEYTIRDVHLNQFVEPLWDIGDALVLHVECVVMGRLAFGNGPLFPFCDGPLSDLSILGGSHTTEKLLMEYGTAL
jgi:hypothetical protein